MSPADHPIGPSPGSPALSRYLELLGRDFPSQKAAAAEIVQLKTRLRLPKGTEYFFSDLHGEHEGFMRMLKSASGTIRDKIETLFRSALPPKEREELAYLVYEPQDMLRRMEKEGRLNETWYRQSIVRLVEVLKTVSAKYTRRMARERIPEAFRNAIDELAYEDQDESRGEYHYAVVRAIVDTGIAGAFIQALADAIRQLCVSRLHIIGDVFDRGPHPDLIMDELILFHDVDVQWGNHDVHWLGAALGNPALIASVVRQGVSYNTFDLLEDAYGINLRPLSAFAQEVYQDDPCEAFSMKDEFNQNLFDTVDPGLGARMQKAMAVLQFKLEGQLIKRHPEYGMDERDVFSRVDFARGTVSVSGKEYPLRDVLFPTVDPRDPLKLSPGEEELMKALTASFLHSQRLQKHMRFLISHGSLYLRCNGNLLYHGCVPMREDGSLQEVEMDGKKLSGREYFDAIDEKVRRARFAPQDSASQADARDYLWYLWCGPLSPIFGKDRMATFERALIEDKGTHKETMNPYYRLMNGEETCRRILAAFGLDPMKGHIVNGHVPVKISKGESPVKGGGRLFMIDGGMSKAYQGTTGIGGYTLIHNSHSYALAQHPATVQKEGQLVPYDSPMLQVVEKLSSRQPISQTDEVQELNRSIAELEALIAAYQKGEVIERGAGIQEHGVFDKGPAGTEPGHPEVN